MQTKHSWTYNRLQLFKVGPVLEIYVCPMDFSTRINVNGDSRLKVGMEEYLNLRTVISRFMNAERVSRPEYFVTTLTGIRQSFNMSLHVVPHIHFSVLDIFINSNFSTYSTGVRAIFISKHVFMDPLIDFIQIAKTF